MIDSKTPNAHQCSCGTWTLAVLPGRLCGTCYATPHDAGFQGTDEITADTRQARIDGMVDKLFN